MKISVKSLCFFAILISVILILLGIYSLLRSIINTGTSIYPVLIIGLMYICLLFFAYVILKKLKKRKSLFNSIHRGFCKTCHKRKFLNSDNECFFCWDNSN